MQHYLQATNRKKLNVKLPTCSSRHALPHIAKQMIQTFKAHFISILSGVSITFPTFLWDKLLPQTKLTLNLLRQSNIEPTISAWDRFNGSFNFNATPLASLCSPIIIHNKPGTSRSWEFRGPKFSPSALHSRNTAASKSSTHNQINHHLRHHRGTPRLPHLTRGHFRGENRTRPQLSILSPQGRLHKNPPLATVSNIQAPRPFLPLENQHCACTYISQPNIDDTTKSGATSKGGSIPNPKRATNPKGTPVPST